MKFAPPLIEGVLLRRYKRFLADVQLPNGEQITAHTPNTGAMYGCAEPGSRVWLRDTASTTRKYRYAWELVENRQGIVIGINTGIVNALVAEAISTGIITQLQGYSTLRQEVRYGVENSRIDLLLERPDHRCYVEIKNVTAADATGGAFFPDAASVRASKHLRELVAMVAEGQRSVLCFCVQRADATSVSPADAIDPLYGQSLREALAAGVEVIAYRADLSPQSIELRTPLPVVCP